MSKKKILISVLLALFVVSGCFLSGCSFEEFSPDREKIISNFKENRLSFISAAKSASQLGNDIYITTSEKFPVGEDKAKGISGLYCVTMSEGNPTRYENISDEAIEILLTSGGVDSIAVSADGDRTICEFNCGGSGRYYFGIYYSSTNAPVFLGNMKLELREKEDGYYYKSSDVSYYTSQIEDGYFYFEAVY